MPSRAFNIPLDFYREELRYKKVARHKKDRKASHDAKPRIQRTTEDLQPMDVVVMDVHHINVLIERETGKTATAKMIAFLDLGTNRLFIEIIMFEGKGGVRNSDIITAFINMCMDPAFGLPKVLYVDNGSEYGWADHLQDALKLNIRINGFDWQSNRNPVVRAIPYNASAKHTEGVFRQLNQQLIAVIPGFIGDDRMNQKREKLGKSMPPFPGSFDDFATAVKKLVYGAYGWAPQYGELKGAAPLEKFKQFVDAGWTATVVDGDDLLSVFTNAKPKAVRQGRIRHENRYFTCDALNAMGDGWVTAHIPKYHGFSALRITNAKGDFLGFGHVIFPAIPVLQRGGKVIEFGVESFYDYKAHRAPGADAMSIQFGYEGRPFSLDQYTLDAPVPREFIQDAQTVPGIDLGKRAVNTVMDSLTLSLEIEQAELASNPANYGADNKLALTGGSKWDDPASAPMADIEEAKDRVRTTCGVEPNRMAISNAGFKALKHHPKIVERFKYTTAESVTAKMLAGLFDLDEVAVGNPLPPPFAQSEQQLGRGVGFGRPARRHHDQIETLGRQIRQRAGFHAQPVAGGDVSALDRGEIPVEMRDAVEVVRGPHRIDEADRHHQVETGGDDDQQAQGAVGLLGHHCSGNGGFRKVIVDL